MIFSTQSEGTQKSSGMALSNVHTHKYIMCAQARKSTHTMATLWWWRILVKNMQTHPREGKKRIMACQVTNTDLFWLLFQNRGCPKTDGGNILLFSKFILILSSSCLGEKSRGCDKTCWNPRGIAPAYFFFYWNERMPNCQFVFSSMRVTALSTMWINDWRFHCET